MEKIRPTLLDAVDPEVHEEFGRSREVIEKLDGESWPEIYRVLKGELRLSGERALEETCRVVRGNLSLRGPSDVGAQD